MEKVEVGVVGRRCIRARKQQIESQIVDDQLV
jgi:hypothetical protein